MWIAVLAIQLWASDPISSTIDRAQQLALKKDRQGAAALLNRAIDDNRPPLKGRGRLIEALGNMGRVFFTDKGQKLFEAGQSLMFENPDGAMNQFRDALTLEDNNTLVLNNVARLGLAKSDCSLAATQLLKARALDPFNAEAALLELRTLICQKNFDDFRLKAKQLPTLDKNQDSFAQFLQAQDYLQQKQWRKATDILLKVSEEEPQFPEPYYYLSRANDELGRESTSWAEKYVALCKGISLKARKRFSLEPRLCGFAKEVEDELSKKNADI